MNTARRRHGFLICLLLLVSGTARAQSGWIELASDHFVLYTDTDEEKGRRLLVDLESRHRAFSETFVPLDPRHSAISVLLVSDREEFQRYLPGEALLDERPAYLFRGGDEPVLIARDRSPDDLIDAAGHSLGHLFLARSLLWQPFWLQEAAGEYVRRLGRDDTDEAVGSGKGFPIDDLVTIVPSAAYDDLAAGGDFRNEAYHLLRILLAEHRQEFQRYLAALRTREGSDARLELDSAVLEAKVFAYNEAPVPLSAANVQPAMRELGPDEAGRVRGDLARAAGAESLARDFYRDNPRAEAHIGQAVLRKLQAESPSVRSAFELLVDTYPDSGWAHYHFGTLRAETARERAQQIASLEKAVELMPLLGRAQAELGYLYVLDGRPEDAMPLIDRAIDLEPEYGDRFFEILAEAWLVLEDYARSRDTIQKAQALPHSDAAAAERYAVLVPQFLQKIDLHRREREAERVEALRRRVEALVEENDPRPVPVPVEPAPVGRIAYSLSSRAASDVAEPPLVEAPMPVYSAELRREGVEGRVVLDVGLDRRGNVVSIQVASADDLDLAAASVDAVRRWEFEPARQAGVSVPYTFRLTLRFYLE